MAGYEYFITPRENPRRRSVGLQNEARFNQLCWGFKRNQPKSWQWKQKQWKPIKRRSEAKNCSKVTFRVTTLNPYKSGLEWTFEALPVPKIISWEFSSCRKRTQVNCTSGGRAMAIQRGLPSVEFLQNWWKLLICVQTLVSQAWSGVLQKFKNLEPSEWSALAMEQAPRTVAPLEGKLQPDRVSKCHSIFTNFGKMTISRAWNGLFQKFKKLKSLV